MDPLTFAAGVGALATAAGVGGGLRLRRRLRRAETATHQLRDDLHAERRAATHDSLTGLPNRLGFHRIGTERIGAPVRPALACVVVDLNSFKLINDRLGHAAGDEVLLTVGARLASYAGDDLVARLGGDEFAGLFSNPSTGWQLLYPAADSLAELVSAPMWVAGQWLHITAAIGVSAVCRGSRLPEVLQQADSAMYRAKLTGVGVACFNPALDTETTLLPRMRAGTVARAPLATVGGR